MSRDTDHRVGLLGTGRMGTAMAHRLLEQGFSVLAWNRDTDRAAPLAGRGAEIADSAADVVARTQAVITMVTTADVVREIVEPLLGRWPEETAWLQMSSVGATEADGLAELAAAHGVTFFDAPVSGSTRPAEEGRLTILASGPDAGRDRVEPIFAALGSEVQWVGPAGMGSRLKLAANAWMIAMVAALAEAMHLCRLMGLDDEQFVTLLDQGPLGSPYGVEKLGEMQGRDYPAGFPVRLAMKDLKLVREVAKDASVELPLTDAVLERLGGVEKSHDDEDLAVVYELKLPGEAPAR